MSSESLKRAGELIDPLIRTLLNDPPFDERPSARELGMTLALWWVAITRAVDSGHAAWESFERSFSKQPRTERDPIARYEAMLDYSTIFLVGAMVLEDLAFAELERRKSVPTKKNPFYWWEFVGLVDELPDDPMRARAIRLDLTLYEGRNLLAAHRRPAHISLPIHSSSGGVTLERVTLPADRGPALALLQEAAAGYEGLAPADANQIERVIDVLVALAPRLSADARRKIKQANRLIGFRSGNVAAYIRETVKLIEAHMAAVTGEP